MIYTNSKVGDDMKQSLFKAFYDKNHISLEQYQKDAGFILDLETQFSWVLEEINPSQLDDIIAYMVEKNLNTIPNIVILMRYYKATSNHGLFIHLTKYTGSLGVIESILNKLERVVGKDRASAIKAEITIPPLGTPLNEMPVYTKHLLTVFETHLSKDEMKKTLSDNHHQIPKEAFLSEQVYYEAANTLDDYLSDLHQRKVAELEQHYRENRVWFEQEINPEVIEFVRNNPEILSAVRKENQLFITKIPYDTKAYLNAKTKEEQKYHACHCPFVKSIFLDQHLVISPTWCDCSGGFTKFPFEVLFSRSLDITCIETPLNGDPLCRFVISLDGVSFKQ